METEPLQKKLNLIFLLPAALIFLMICPGCSKKINQDIGAGKDWAVYLADNFSSHYSKLTEINKENIRKLKLAWEYHTGDDVRENRSQIQCNPIIINGILFGTSPKLKVFAINAATGEQIWKIDPDSGRTSAANVNRGVSYWKAGSDERILFSSGQYLYSVYAATGKPDVTFGATGRVSLKEGLGERSKELYVVATSPGIIFHDLIIIGSRVSESEGAAPGFIRAFNVRTGKLEWVFHTIPQPGEFGYDTWPEDAWKTAGGVNSWAGMSLDQSRGIVYISTGSAAFDFWGGNRKGANLFANCILAIEANTGKRVWHFQTIHHDLWDRDLPAPPNLIAVKHKGRKIDAVAQVCKTGYIFLLDRETGVPLFPVEEKPVPSSDLLSEASWPSQPFPTSPPPFTPQLFTEEQITDINPESHDYISGIFNKIRTKEMFIPPSTQGTLIFPGFDGGGEWGGAAIDPGKSILYVNSNIMPWILEMVDVNQGAEDIAYKVNCAVCHGSEMQGDPTGTFPSLKAVSEKFTTTEIRELMDKGKGIMPSFKHLTTWDKNGIISSLTKQKNGKQRQSEAIQNKKSDVPYAHKGYNRFLDQNGYPAIKPPWGILSAVDLNKGEILWQVPLGEFEELTARGIPRTGTENYGGPVVTAGGIIFIGASKDGFFRAIDKDTGEELWKYKLPAGAYATPSVFEAGGKQFVVIACGGGKMGTPSGDSYLAFSLEK